MPVFHLLFSSYSCICFTIGTLLSDGFRALPAAVSSISLFALLVLLLGFIPQKETHAGILSTAGMDHL